MKQIRVFILSVAFVAATISLRSQTVDSLSYDLTKPDQIFLLPEVLEEISGLTWFGANRLATLNDEQGRVYIYDLQQREIVQRFRFEGNGDFEGIEFVNNYIYAIKSNGNIYRFNIDMSGVVEKISSPFDSDNNVEGLGYNHLTDQLLIALKDDGDIKGVNVKGKAVYGYHLASKKFTEVPVFTLPDKELERVLGAKKKKFKPSGVAVHPETGEIYLLAASGRALIVFHPNGKPKNLTLLRAALFPQAEGICFAPNGDLYISNEGEGEGGTILRFRQLPD